MRRCLCWLILFGLALHLPGAERKFDLSNVAENQPPPGFRSAVTGKGKPGDWKVILEDVPPALPGLTPEARGSTKRAVLAQLSQDPADEHFPLLIYDEETYADFTLRTRFKTVSGGAEQMAGIAFRVQNETNYYVVRASSLGNTFRFYKVANGERGPLVGPEIKIPSGTWHELEIECKGNQIRCSLNGKDLVSVTDKINPFSTGKIAFWTKSDSVSYFYDTRIVYTLREAPAQTIVREELQKNPRLVDLKIYVAGSEPKTSKAVSSKTETQLGEAGGNGENAVLAGEGIYQGKEKGIVSVVMPLRDRNGDIIAAARVMMKSFPGQTEQNALARAMPIVQSVQRRVHSLEDLVD